MASPILVFGHKNPDNDALCAAVGYAYLKNELARAEGSGLTYEACRLGGLPPETAWLLEEQGVEVPRLIESVGEGDRVILVDHNEVQQSADGLLEAEIVEVVDHHRIGGLVTANPIRFNNLPIGSSAAVVAREFEVQGVELPKHIATLLLSAMLTDTVIMKSPTTTDYDRQLTLKIAEYVGVDPVEFGMEVFKCRSNPAEIAVEKMIGADAKEFPLEDGTMFIAQFETVDLQALMAREDEIRAAMRAVVDSKGYRFMLFLATDILAEGSNFICEGETGLVNHAFGIDVEGKAVWMPGVLSRKKQVAAPLLAAK